MRSSSDAWLRMLVAVDLVVLTVRDEQLQVLLVERGEAPFLGHPALPGGFIRAGESADETARRELLEETGLDGSRLFLEQLYTYSRPDRDPRERVVTVAYLTIAPDLPIPKAGTDAKDARWQPVSAVEEGRLPLAFDHDRILADGIERARAKLEYTNLAIAFCDVEFTIGDLRRVYEVVWGMPIDPRNFHRKVVNTVGLLEPVGRRRSAQTGRPAALFRAGPAMMLNPPILRQAPRSRRCANPGPDGSSVPSYQA